MGTKFLSLMLVVTQLMSWASAPLHLCISKSGSVCIEISGETCTCCTDGDHEKHDTEPSTCCGHCDADESDDHAVVVLTTPCDCTYIPLTIEQSDSVRPSIASCTITWDASVSWLHAPHEIIPSTISVLILHWDRRDNPSRHPVALATTVLRC